MVKRILQYLGNFPDEALVYKGCVGQPFYFFAMVDASYGSVTTEARSHTGYMLWSNVGLLHYKSVAQKTIATSSSSAEMRAAFHCGKDTLSMRALLREVAFGLGKYVCRAIERMGNTINYYIFSKNLKIIINNQSCLKLTKLVDTESAAGAYSSCGGMRRSFLQIANSTGVLVSLNWHTRSERL